MRRISVDTIAMLLVLVCGIPVLGIAVGGVLMSIVKMSIIIMRAIAMWHVTMGAISRRLLWLTRLLLNAVYREFDTRVRLPEFPLYVGVCPLDGITVPSLMPPVPTSRLHGAM